MAKNKTKKQVLNELTELHKRVIELEELVERYKQREMSLRESEKKYRFMIDSTEDSIYMVDEDCRYICINKRHLERLGISGEEMHGRRYGDFHSDEETKNFEGIVKRVFETGESLQQEHRSMRDNRYFLRTFSPVKSQEKTVAVSVISKNITDLKQLEERLVFLSLTDELTGLCNRRGFLALSEQQLKIARRLKKVIYILYADIDGLKDINDTYGHNAGDRLLIEAADILKAVYREFDVIGRIGGDEFAVFLMGDNESQADVFIERLKEMIDIHNEKGDIYKLSMSVGITYCSTEQPCAVDDLLIKADKLMYEQKMIRRRNS